MILMKVFMQSKKMHKFVANVIEAVSILMTRVSTIPKWRKKQCNGYLLIKKYA